MPLLAVSIVLLSVALTLFYGIPTSGARLEDYAKERLTAQASAAAEAIAREEGRNPRPSLRQAADTGGGEALLVDNEGRVMDRAGDRLLPSEPELLRRLAEEAADGGSIEDEVEGLDVSVAPVVYGDGGDVAGGVVLASGEFGGTLYPLFLRGSLEAAGIAAVVGGGLMLFLATLLGRRVERLSFGASSIERGDFSHRIEPGFDDELGGLAKSFNAMATRLEEFVARLEENNETLDAVLENLTEGVLMTDTEARIVFANRAAREMLHMDGEPYAELPDPWEDFDLEKAVAQCIAGRERVAARVRDGEAFLHVEVHRLPESGEREEGALVVVRDLSEGRRLEANQQRFLDNAAHELKTPITTILGAADLLLTEEEDDPEVRNRFLGRILSEAERMQRLSDTLLRLARTGFDVRDPQPEILELESAARDAASRMEPLAESAGVHLHVEGKGARVHADAEWLEQALLVLISNAVKHSGRVRLRVEGAAVVVEDDGEGISEEELPFVFERFHRGGSDGSGLGLPICKELVERMGGEVSISSEKGRGTRAGIELPEAEAHV